MNKISKYAQYLQSVQPISFNVMNALKCTIQNHTFSTINLSKLNFPIGIKTLRHASSTSQIGFTNLVDTNDILLTSIKKARETSDVLEMLRLHNSVMTEPQYLQALTSIFVLQKSSKTKLSKEELTRSPEFTALCYKIQNNSRNLELNDIINSIKCLSYLGVSVNSNVMQMLLQLISKMVNEMSLQQISFLHFLVKDLPPCPLIDALKLALPIVFETQVQYKLDENVNGLVEFLNYITKHKLSQRTFDLVMSRVLKNIDRLNPRNMKNLLLFLYHKDYSTDKYLNEINKCLSIYKNNLESIAHISDIEAILNRMVTKYLNESEMFYNEEFINSLVSHLIKKNEHFGDVGFVVKKLNKIGYVHRGLINYMTDQISSNLEILENSKFGVLLSYIAACANANYIPPGFIELKPHILKRLNMQKDVLELPWLIVAYDLAVLDCWSEELLERVFSRNFLYEFLKRGEHFHDYVMLLKLYQATMTLYPGGYKGSLPKNEFLNKAIELYQQNIDYFPLKAPLEQGLGGEDYVLTGVRSKLGHFIDHVVVMRPGGYSVAIKNDKSKLLLEDIIDSNENLVIGILLYKPNSYVINLNCLRGPFALTNKTIEALGVVLLPISLDVWNGLMDYEKIPFIMRELKSKADVTLTEQSNLTH